MFLDELNENQRNAVVCCDAPQLVIAGAGSGKTRVLTYKIAYLLGQGFDPWHILSLTFTNKAAREMQQRISKLVGEDKARYLWMGTFHSIFSRILRIESSILGFNSDFTIYDATDSRSLIRGIIREMGLDDKQYKPQSVASRISNAKNALVMPSAYRNNSNYHRADESARMPAIADIYERYFLRCRQSNAMDFDDLLLYTWVLFRDNPDVVKKYQDRFQYILVDEYQDTNYAQHQIVWQLSNQRQRVCVVGDDAQSIYSFRGANIDNILKFQSTYSGAKLFKLEQNYRSTQTIVGAANSLIHHNQMQIRKDVFSRQEVGNPICVCKAYSDTDEANIVSRKIRNFVRNEHLKFSDIAILYRTNAQSRSFEETLRREGVPYRIYGGLSFYQRKEIKDTIAYFRMAVNPRDEEALRRVINYPARGIGDTTVQKIFSAAQQRQISPWEVLVEPCDLPVNKGTLGKLEKFVQMILGFNARVRTEDAYQLGISIITDSGVRGDVFHGSEPEDISRQENLQELMDGIKQFVTSAQEEGSSLLMSDYLQEVSLLSDVDEDKSDGDDKVTLMTVHSAKGLEFDAVFVVGLEETLFPSQMSQDTPRQIEEERRLFYVAMTRAQHYLVLTYAKSRFRFGQMEHSNPSRFLQEIDARFLRADVGSQGVDTPTPSYMSSWKHRAILRPSSPEPARAVEPVPSTPRRLVRVRSVSLSGPSDTSSLPQRLGAGSKVEHDRFGLGVIQKIEGQGLDAKAIIEFQNVGIKQLLLRFAKLKVVG